MVNNHFKQKHLSVLPNISAAFQKKSLCQTFSWDKHEREGSTIVVENSFGLNVEWFYDTTLNEDQVWQGAGRRTGYSYTSFRHDPIQ